MPKYIVASFSSSFGDLVPILTLIPSERIDEEKFRNPVLTMYCILRGSTRVILYRSTCARSPLVVKSNVVPEHSPILYSKFSVLGIYPLLSRNYHTARGELF